MIGAGWVSVDFVCLKPGVAVAYRNDAPFGCHVWINDFQSVADFYRFGEMKLTIPPNREAFPEN